VINYNVDDVKWLLNKILYLEEQKNAHPSNWPTHRRIWLGCYDVWMCEQDRIDAVEIPKMRMKEAEEAGFIKNEIRKIGKFDSVVWTVTELGHDFLKEETCDG
jgi:hypothetical protein